MDEITSSHRGTSLILRVDPDPESVARGSTTKNIFNPIGRVLDGFEMLTQHALHALCAPPGRQVTRGSAKSRCRVTI